MTRPRSSAPPGAVALADDPPTAPVSLLKDPPPPTDPVVPISLIKDEHRFDPPGDEYDDEDDGYDDEEYDGPDEPPEDPPEPPDGRGTPPARPNLRLISQVLTIVAVLLLGFLLQVTLFGSLRYQRDQAQTYRELRFDLANGLAPVGPLDENGVPLAAGTPVAILDIPQIELHAVVLESATSRVMMSGPAHRRDSPLPGQAGTALVLGRRGAYQGPFRDLDKLKAGDVLQVTTGQGRHDFTVIGLRRAGDPLPPPLTQGKGRLTLVTTDGPVYRPTDVLRVDADLTTDVQDRPPQVPTGSVSPAERFYAGDPSALLPLMLWGTLLLGATAGLVWMRHRVGRKQAWIVGVPVLLMLGVRVLDDLAALLPNLL